MDNETRKIKVRYPDFDFEFYFEMDERNKDLCDEVWQALPFTYVQEHAWVSGHSIYGWVPLISTAEVPVKIPRTEAPMGWVSFEQGTGNKISFKYGEITEDIVGNSLGFIPEEFHEKLRFIGKEIWYNYYLDKKIYTVEMSRLE